jgi:hypothetical protein
MFWLAIRMQQVGFNDSLAFTTHAAAGTCEFQEVNSSPFFKVTDHCADSLVEKGFGRAM